mmetsp:Transcript_9899/g.22510  ORF Transcript_9899/g.22510 Transcript_9899/m.22510 type:complete len:206 (+) Transcript_9899:48-665(+)
MDRGVQTWAGSRPIACAGTRPAAARFVVSNRRATLRQGNVPGQRRLVVRAADARLGSMTVISSDEFMAYGTAPGFPFVQFIVVLLSITVPLAYWWFILVPGKRQELSRSKRRGQMKKYLTGLAASPEEDRKSEKWFYDKYLREGNVPIKPRGDGLPEVTEAIEDRLQETLPGGGFWSFDNPVFLVFTFVAIFSLWEVATHDWTAA